MAGDLDGTQTQEEPQATEDGHKKASQEQPQVGGVPDYSLANPTRSNRVLESFARIVEVPQARFYTKVALNSGDNDSFGYSKASDGRDINFMVVEKSAVIKHDSSTWPRACSAPTSWSRSTAACSSTASA